MIEQQSTTKSPHQLPRDIVYSQTDDMTVFTQDEVDNILNQIKNSQKILHKVFAVHLSIYFYFIDFLVSHLFSSTHYPSIRQY